MKKLILATAAWLLIATTASFAQAPGPVQQSWLPQGRASLSVSSTTGNVALPTGLVANICNTGSVDAYLNFGTANTVAATTAAGYLLRAGYCVPYSRSNFGTINNYVAAITSSSTTTLAIEGGTGTPLTGSLAGGAIPPLPSGAATAANQTSTQAPVTPATATATKSNLIGCQYNSAGAALTDGQQASVQCGPNGRVQTASGTSSRTTNTPTVQNAAYASGNCIGGFNAITVASFNGQTGFLTNFRVLSIGGSTPTITVYVFEANPSASTCTDKGTFTLAAADANKLIATPVPMTLLAPTGATTTFGSVDWTPPRPFIAGGSTASGAKTIYYALVSGSTFTPASTTDIQISTGVALN